MIAALETDALTVAYGDHVALDAVSIAVAPGEAFGIVGESGSGKSTLLRAVAGLAPVTSGEIRVEGKRLAPTRRDRSFLARVQMVFQDPYGSLHPRQTVDAQLIEPLAIHHVPNSERRMLHALEEVGLGADFRFRYPHQLSGGQRQRVAIARALILEPAILLLDEPTSALDASVQAEVLNLLEQVRRDRGLTFVMVSHDLGVVTHMCERLAVMRHGRVVEQLAAADLARGRFETDYVRELIRASEGFRRDRPRAA